MRYLCLTMLAIALTGCVPTTDDRPIPTGNAGDPTSPTQTSPESPPAPGGEKSSPGPGADTPRANPDSSSVNPGDTYPARPSDNPRVEPNPSTAGGPSATSSGGATRPDNTGVNERDSNGNTKTPIDQDETSSDVQITADIRKQILATEGMSVNARNAKIITSKGRVTLRGPVNDDAEKAKVEKIAAGVAGAGNVTSELEVAR